MTFSTYTVRHTYSRSAGFLSELKALDTMRLRGMPQILVRGDGVNDEWFLVERVSKRGTKLAANGVPRVIELILDLVCAPIPCPDAWLAGHLKLLNLLG